MGYLSCRPPSILHPQPFPQRRYDTFTRIERTAGRLVTHLPILEQLHAAMIGDHCIAMIGDAIIKDAPGFDYEEAYMLMRKNAFEANPDSGSYRDGKGRRAMESYLKYNYVR